MILVPSAARLLSASLLFFAFAAGAGSAQTASSPPTPATPDGAPSVSEELQYDWRLEGLQGFLARILPMVPATGEAVLRAAPWNRERLQLTFRATSPKAAADEHWTYTSELDLSRPRTLRTVEAVSYRGKKRKKTFELEEFEVIDILSGLHILRVAPPLQRQRRLIWSDGKIYPVVVLPRGREEHRIGDRPVTVRHYSIRGIAEPGRRTWKERAEIWLTDDEASTPVQILFSRPLGQLRLTLSD